MAVTRKLLEHAERHIKNAPPSGRRKKHGFHLPKDYAVIAGALLTLAVNHDPVIRGRVSIPQIAKVLESPEKPLQHRISRLYKLFT